MRVALAQSQPSEQHSAEHKEAQPEHFEKQGQIQQHETLVMISPKHGGSVNRTNLARQRCTVCTRTAVEAVRAAGNQVPLRGDLFHSKIQQHQTMSQTLDPAWTRGRVRHSWPRNLEHHTGFTLLVNPWEDHEILYLFGHCSKQPIILSNAARPLRKAKGLGSCQKRRYSTIFAENVGSAAR